LASTAAVETSMMLHLAPATVRMEHAHSGAPARRTGRAHAMLGNGKSAKMGWAMQDYHPQAPWAMPCGQRRQGPRRGQAAAQALAQLLQELHALPAQTLAPAPG
jgi:creatinine amidohydrolase